MGYRYRAVCLFQGRVWLIAHQICSQGTSCPQPQILHGILGCLIRRFLTDFVNSSWLVVSTPLQNISQNGNLPQIWVKTKNFWVATTQLLTHLTPRKMDEFERETWWFPIPSSVHLHFSRCHEKRWTMLNIGRVNDQSITCGGNLFKYYIGQIYAPQNQVKSFTQNPLRFFCCHSTTELLLGNLVDSMRLSNLPVFFGNIKNPPKHLAYVTHQKIGEKIPFQEVEQKPMSPCFNKTHVTLFQQGYISWWILRV